MFRDDERAANHEDSDAACQPPSEDALLEDLGRFRCEYAELEGEQQERSAKHCAALYQLAARTVGWALLLRESTAAWARFIASPDWAERKPPKRNQQAHAIKHAVRFVLPHNVSRQVQSYWTIPLKALSDEGIEQEQIAQVLAERGGFEAICKALRKPKLKHPAADIPPILRDAAVVKHADGQSWLEDGSQRRLFILAVEPGLLGRIEPGELSLKAILGETDLSVLELTGVTLNHPAKDLRLRQNPAVHEPNPPISGGSDITQPLES